MNYTYKNVIIKSLASKSLSKKLFSIIDLIIEEEKPNDEKPEEIFHIIEHFCLGRRRLHLFGKLVICFLSFYLFFCKYVYIVLIFNKLIKQLI